MFSGKARSFSSLSSGSVVEEEVVVDEIDVVLVVGYVVRFKKTDIGVMGDVLFLKTGLLFTLIIPVFLGRVVCVSFLDWSLVDDREDGDVGGCVAIFVMFRCFVYWYSCFCSFGL